MGRVYQLVLIASLLPLSWLGMMVVHEFGHVLGAWGTGGTVEKVILHPLTISRTDLSHNPRPLLVAWAGPVVGMALPLAAWGLASVAKMPGRYLLRFFAGFCLIANGVYIGVGSFDKVGDAGDLLRHGAEAWHLWLFGAVCGPCGLLLWHNLGPHFGLGKVGKHVNPVVAFACLAALILLITLELALGEKG